LHHINHLNNKISTIEEVILAHMVREVDVYLATQVQIPMDADWVLIIKEHCRGFPNPIPFKKDQP
jgi:hypothetical protein